MCGIVEGMCKGVLLCVYRVYVCGVHPLPRWWLVGLVPSQAGTPGPEERGRRETLNYS